mgnify:CR=1 FL=1
MATRFDADNLDIAWCPGCGNFGLFNSFKKAVKALEVWVRRVKAELSQDEQS